MGFFFVVYIILQTLTLALADDPCQAYATGGKTCSMTPTGDGGFDCTCVGAPTFTTIPSSLLPAEFQIEGVGSKKCVDVSLRDKDRVHIWDCKGKKDGNQVWRAQPAPGGGYYLSVQHTGKCLSIKNSNWKNGTPVVPHDCNGGANQVWQLRNPDGKNTEIYNPASGGKCLDVEEYGTKNGVKLQTYECRGNLPNQHFNINGL